MVFSYPNVTVPGHINETVPDSYGTLTPEDLNTLQKFWTDIYTNPGQFGSNPADAAYVVPNNFGFGFRSEGDTIWGLFPAASDSYTAKIWGDTQFLMMKYPDQLNIIYDNQTIIKPTLKAYTKVFYYNHNAM